MKGLWITTAIGTIIVMMFIALRTGCAINVLLPIALAVIAVFMSRNQGAGTFALGCSGGAAAALAVLIGGLLSVILGFANIVNWILTWLPDVLREMLESILRTEEIRNRLLGPNVVVALIMAGFALILGSLAGWVTALVVPEGESDDGDFDSSYPSSGYTPSGSSSFKSNPFD